LTTAGCPWLSLAVTGCHWLSLAVTGCHWLCRHVIQHTAKQNDTGPIVLGMADTAVPPLSNDDVFRVAMGLAPSVKLKEPAVPDSFT
jgi:hypothetical protein